MRKFSGNEDVGYCGKIWHVCSSGHHTDPWSGHVYYKIYRGNRTARVRSDSLKEQYVW